MMGRSNVTPRAMNSLARSCIAGNESICLASASELHTLTFTSVPEAASIPAQ